MFSSNKLLCVLLVCVVQVLVVLERVMQYALALQNIHPIIKLLYWPVDNNIQAVGGRGGGR